MALTASQVAVSTTAVQLSSAETDDRAGSSVAVLTCTVDIYLGATSSVTTGTGAKLPAGSAVSVDLAPGEQLWAIAASSGTAHVLRTGV